jgi:UDP-N-acetylmuramoylalanine--D-glutamate ligase
VIAKSIGILGAGESGIGAALLAKKLGIDFYLSDKSPVHPRFVADLKKHQITCEEGVHELEKLLKCDWVVKSPGIPNSAGIIQQITEAGIPVISEIEFASRFTQAKIVAITGSNGKTTTTSLTGHLLKEAGLKVGIGGNIGKSFARMLAEEEEKDIYVLEISSFQCENLEYFKPHIAILTNFSPDHLDRYNYRMEEYVAAKFMMIKNMDKEDHFIYNTEDEWTMKILENNPPICTCYGFGMQENENTKAFVNEDNHLILSLNPNEIMKFEDRSLPGIHNSQNSMASAMAARLLQVRKESIRESLMNFDALEHRLEPAGSIRGVHFINDSKATNVNATWYALESVSKPVVWIVGGVDKGNNYGELMSMVEDKVKAIVCLGLDNTKLLDEFTGKVKVITETRSMEKAVKMAFSLSDKGDTVLLSPACASFDLFNNYEDRGEQFKYWVRQL